MAKKPTREMREHLTKEELSELREATGEAREELWEIYNLIAQAEEAKTQMRSDRRRAAMLRGRLEASGFIDKREQA